MEDIVFTSCQYNGSGWLGGWLLYSPKYAVDGDIYPYELVAGAITLVYGIACMLPSASSESVAMGVNSTDSGYLLTVDRY